jgi:hypothetical protein
MDVVYLVYERIAKAIFSNGTAVPLENGENQQIRLFCKNLEINFLTGLSQVKMREQLVSGSDRARV